MKYLLSTTALGVLLAITPAVAQDKPAGQQPPAAQQSQTPPATPSTPPAGGSTTDMQKSAPGSTAQTDKPADTAKSDKAGGSGDVQFVQEQKASDWLASDLIGQAVVNANDESVGDINDLLVNESGKVTGVIIGVGGFLGIGEKKVAVAYDGLNISKGENDTQKVSLNVTKESLESAPEFMSAEDKAAEQERASRPAPSSPMGGGGGSPR